MPDQEHFEVLETAANKAMTSVLNCPGMMSNLPLIKELLVWAVFRRTGQLEPGMSKDWEGRVGQLHSQLNPCVETILRPTR